MNAFAKATFRIATTGVILLAAALCRADDAPQRTRPMENRFLIVIDTSSSMKSRTNGIEEAVAGLLKSDMHGEFRKGDTLGVWTYDEQIHADFPMQVWSQENKDAIAADVLRYVRHQRYEKRAHLEKVLRAVGQVMEQSERLTVIFIYDGTELIRGTQFDGDINDLQKRYARQFRSAHLPMVTILAARSGQVFDYTINYPGSMTIPHTAIALPPPQTNAPPAAPIAVAAIPQTNAAPAAPRPPPRTIQIVMSGTNSVTRTITQTESAANNPASGPSNIVMVAAPPSQPPPAKAIPAPIAVEPIASNPPPPAPTPEPEASKPVAVTAQPEPTPVLAPPPPKVLPTTASLLTPAAAPAPVISPAPAPAPAMSPASAPVMSPAPSPAPAPLAVVSTGQQVALFVIAFSLFTIAVVLVVFLVRRSRGDGPPSLISQSIDRGR
jgi:hypothetical protein